MPNSREQSLDEDVVFLPVSESSPQFIYCEKERRAVERLLSSGPEAFYSSIGTELPGCFLSPEEVCQISSWAQDYRFKAPPEVTQSSTPPEDSSSTYFPPNSDIPTPDLELGWPEKDPWPVKGNVTVHTNPPAEGDPPIREIIRRHLQQASKVGLSPFQHIFIKDSCGFNSYKVKWHDPVTFDLAPLPFFALFRVTVQQQRNYSVIFLLLSLSWRLEGSFGVRDVVFPLQVIAIVTDRLTDCAVIADLHSAASRGVAIYIILNQRSVQETFTLKKLRHPVSHVRLKRPHTHSSPGT